MFPFRIQFGLSGRHADGCPAFPRHYQVVSLNDRKAIVRGAVRRPEARRAVKRLLPSPGPRRFPLGLPRGITMMVDFDFQSRAFLGLYEVELSRHLRRLCTPGTRSFDVGAQFGYDTLILAKLSGERVACFEPDPACLETMTANVALNPELRSLITTVPSWVGTGVDGTLALDDYASSQAGFVPDLIKIDVEGAETHVLEGARGLLIDRLPHILLEVHSRDLERWCGAMLVEHGYHPTIVNQRRVLRDHRPISHNRWLIAEGRTS